MSKVIYPSFVQKDFSKYKVNEYKELLDNDIHEVYQILIHLLQKQEKEQLTCILRIVLERSMDETTVYLLSWFMINNLMPPQVQYLFLQSIFHKMDEKDGIKLCLALIKGISPRFSKYPLVAKRFISIPNFNLLNPDLYLMVYQFNQDTLNIDNFIDPRHHYICSNESNKIEIDGPSVDCNFVFPDIENSPIQLKENLSKSMQFAQTLSDEDLVPYSVLLFHKYTPPSFIKRDDRILKMACKYAVYMIKNYAKWEEYTNLQKIYYLGRWVGGLSIQNGKPPNLCDLNIHRLLLDSIKVGYIIGALTFLKGYMKIRHPAYDPPNPYTTRILEIVTSLYHVKWLRTDIILEIDEFSRTSKLELFDFYIKDIEISSNSPILCSRFYTPDENTYYFKSPEMFDPKYERLVNDSQILYSYIHYVPERSMLPDILKDVYDKATYSEKYYFVGNASDIKNPIKFCNEQNLLQCLISLALSDSIMLSQLASEMFAKASRNTQIDLSPLFRCEFPNRYIISNCIKKDCINTTNLNSLFSELLTNPETRPVCKPLIESFLPILLSKYSENDFFSSIKLSGYRKTNSITQELILPDINHIGLLRSFINTCKSKSTEDFLNKFRPITSNHFKSLFLFVLHTAKESSSVTCSTKYDYSAIDTLTYILARSTVSFDINSITDMAFKAIETIAPRSILSTPLTFFRLVYDLLTHLNFKDSVKLQTFLRSISPLKYPSFNSCWIQLVMHRHCFPTFIRQNSKDSIQFCVDFINTLSFLVQQSPDVCYKPVARVLMTISVSAPHFFVIYFGYLLKLFPLQYVQLRNIIIAVDWNQDPDMPPPYSYHFNKEIIDSRLRNVNMSIQTKLEILNEENMWDFVFHLICNPRDNDGKILLNIIQNVPVSTISAIINALLDNVRFRNKHTTLAIDLINHIFENCKDDNLREQFIVEISKRILSVRPIPHNLHPLFTRLNLKYGPELKRIFSQKSELETFNSVKEIMKENCIKRSPSGHIIVIHE